MWYQQLLTPAAVIDLPVLRANIATMAGRADQLGVRLRPHVKTHRCAEIARLQTQDRDSAITVSTLAEARFFVAAGFCDLCYAVPLAPARLRAVADLARSIDHLHLVVDHPHTVSLIETFGEQQRQSFSVFLKVDCGGHRAGVDPEQPLALALAGRLSRSPWIALRGILTHAGHAYACRNRQEIAAVGRQEWQSMVTFKDKLERAGVPVPELSIGSTPTLCTADQLPGITEVRPGNYVFFDAFQVAIGACSFTDVSLTVLTSVIGSYPHRNELVVDAGALALSKDPGPVQVDHDCGFGTVLTADGGRHLEPLRLVSLSQEHGVIRSSDGGLTRSLTPGTTLRIVPNHSCLAAAMFDHYSVLDGDQVVDQWSTV